MIEFVSLFFGLLNGVHVVEMNVTGPVAAIELRLDGRTVEVLRGPPWLVECDFGEQLQPHELVAVARDARGGELDLARQWINIRQQSDAEAAMVFRGGERGLPQAVGLVWESIGERRPRSIELEFDGQPLAVRDPSHVPLPAYDPEAMHFLSATLQFQDTVSRLEASFGGGRGSEIQTELTAVAVTIDKGVKTPRPEDLAGWFLAAGEPVAVHGMEQGEAEVVVVRDPAAQPLLEELISEIRPPSAGWRTGSDPGAYGSLGRKAFLRVLSPASAPLSPGEVAPEMFIWSSPRAAATEGLLWLSQQDRPRTFPVKFSNAVAVSGLRAHASTRRRAVVLLLGGSPSGEQAYSPENVRAYLRLLQVPLFVWSLTGEPHPLWPEAEELDLTANPQQGYRRFRQAVRELRANLEAQRIVWLEGSYLPQTIELAPHAQGIRLAGSGP